MVFCLFAFNIVVYLGRFLSLVGRDSTAGWSTVSVIHVFVSFFSLQKEETDIPSGYIENERSMLKLLYDNVFFVARKPL